MSLLYNIRNEKWLRKKLQLQQSLLLKKIKPLPKDSAYLKKLKGKQENKQN